MFIGNVHRTLVDPIAGLAPSECDPLLMPHHAEPEAQVVDQHVQTLVLFV